MTISALPENAPDIFKELVAKFKPTPYDAKKKDIVTNPDTVIGVRIKPLSSEEVKANDAYAVLPRLGAGNVVDLHELKMTARGQILDSSSYRLDKVYGPNVSTDVIYDGLVKPLLHLAWGGGIGTLFAYGQTGSGKTFTVNGIEKNVARELMSGTLDGTRTISVSMIELVGNLTYDLINDRKPVSIFEDTFNEVMFVGASETQINTAEDFVQLIDQANTFRAIASTEKNDTSSRSHAICRISIANPSIPSAPAGLLYLVDLAGSEGARDVVDHKSDRMKEAREINKSLSVLTDCIRGRAQADTPSSGKLYIPFRQANLTKALKHVFDPDIRRASKTSVITCVNPSFLDGQQSKNTLRYAEMLRVAVPHSNVLKFDKERPITWSNEDAQEWISKNSGTPAINPKILAPFESGAQLIRIPQPEFVQRCLKTPGVNELQAQAFFEKVWRQHIDNPKKKPTKPLTAPIVAKDNSHLPFDLRIKPGMIVLYNSIHDKIKDSLALILCPDWAVETHVVDIRNVEVKGERNVGRKRYLCAVMAPAAMHGAFELSVGRQVLVDLADMEEEVSMEYDGATRFYHLNV
ncbi:diatom spindle kinesin 1 [Venturia nashicola]|nr:diatom spindle kinesin 1 [Venturia nashicola]